MAKSRTQYVCQQCGKISIKPMGRCPQCNSWNSMVEEVVAPKKAGRKAGDAGAASTPRRLAEIDVMQDDRVPLTMNEFSRVLGGGIIDSIQSIYSSDISSSAGSLSQVRECASRLHALAKARDVATFIVGHVTKEGSIAGPKVLEHIVDTVLYLEGDSFHAYRLLRSVKNRFGATTEVGVFEMQSTGMVEVENPSEVFLAERMVNAPGSAIVVTMEGTRPLIVEIQGLTSATSFGHPRRTANGVDYNRLLLTIAVLSRRVGLRLADQDVFVNVVGGLRVQEPAADLAVAAAVASSIRDKALPANLALIGEIGLSGELRTVSQLESRLKEAAKLGFKRILVPKRARVGEKTPAGIEIVPVRSVGEALETAFGGS
ncbi:MAG: DNA repair protein RadA [Anaerolineales bacterium]